MPAVPEPVVTTTIVEADTEHKIEPAETAPPVIERIVDAVKRTLVNPASAGTSRP